MELAKIWWPKSEAELATVVCLLNLQGIPHFVHGADFGSAWPGLQIHAYNARTVMVPLAYLEQAQEALAPLEPSPSEPEPKIAASSRFRILMEALFLGWFVPGRGSADGT